MDTGKARVFSAEVADASGGGTATVARISVVIPSSGPSTRLRRCLEALARQRVPPEEVVVVVPEAAPALDPTPGLGLTVLRDRGALSFCRSVNRGIAATRGEWVLLLNDDVVLSPSFLERLVEAIPSDEHIGMVCGKLLAMNGRMIDSTGQFVSRARTAAERGHGAEDRHQFDVSGYVFSVPGAAALYRRQMLEAIAIQGRSFDERLRIYLEDLDLGYRAQAAGWRAYYAAQAVAYHARGATAKSRPPRWSWLRRYYLPWLAPRLQARYLINRYTLIFKYDTWRSLLRDSPWLLWYELRLWSYLLLHERGTVRRLWTVFRRFSPAMNERS